MLDLIESLVRKTQMPRVPSQKDEVAYCDIAVDGGGGHRVRWIAHGVVKRERKLEMGLSWHKLAHTIENHSHAVVRDGKEGRICNRQDLPIQLQCRLQF